MHTAKEEVISAILAKKELQSVDRGFILQELEVFLRQDLKARKYLASEKISVRSGEFKRIVKAVRSRLRRAHSLFDLGKKSVGFPAFISSLDSVKSWKTLSALGEDILASHASSKERLSDYPLLFQWLVDEVGEFQNILDLGCGLHPLSLVFLDKKKLGNLNYTAYDINLSEKKLLNMFFEAVARLLPSFSGKADVLNLLNSGAAKFLASQKPVDLCFMLKVTDHLDRGKGHKETEKILQAVQSSYVLLSFPTITRSGAPMRYPKRRWVEYLCRRLGYGFTTLQTKNELFYLIEKE